MDKTIAADGKADLRAVIHEDIAGNLRRDPVSHLHHNSAVVLDIHHGACSILILNNDRSAVSN